MGKKEKNGVHASQSGKEGVGNRNRANGREILFLVILFLACLFFRLLYQNRFETEIGLDHSQVEDLDTQTYHLWGENLANGDWLSREMYHPYHWWTRPIGPASKWESWYGKTTFHQAPLYPYLIGFLYSIFGINAGVVAIFQALLGSCTILLIYLLVRSMLGLWPAVFSSLFSALLIPSFFYEKFLLRESLLLFLTALLLLLAVRAIKRRTPASWGWTGLALGLNAVAKPTILIFLPFLLIESLRKSSKQRTTVALFIAALLLPFLPIAARNLSVGAGLFTLTTRGPCAFINGNSYDGPGCEWHPPPSTKEILEKSNYRMGRVILETIRTHPGPWSFFRLQWKKFTALFNGYEFPNNVNFYRLREVLSILRLPLPDFHLLLALGLTGMILGWTQRRKYSLFYFFFLTYTVSILAFFFVARFRLPLIPPLAVFSGLLFLKICEFTQRRRFGCLLLSLASIAFFLWLTWPSGIVPPHYQAKIHVAKMLLGNGSLVRAEGRFNEILEDLASQNSEKARNSKADAHFGLAEIYRRRNQFDKSLQENVLARKEYPCPETLYLSALNLGTIYFHQGRSEDARKEYLQAIQHGPDKSDPYYAIANLAFREKDYKTALSNVKMALERDPSHFDAIFLMAFLQEAYLGDRGEAEKFYRKALEIRPSHEGAKFRLENL